MDCWGLRSNFRIGQSGNFWSSRKTGLVVQVESSFTLVTKITVVGPSRLKEEYVEGRVASPRVPDGTIPPQFKGLFDQLISTVQRLPDAIKEALNGGVKIPLSM